jgi:hypothetical protein
MASPSREWDGIMYQTGRIVWLWLEEFMAREGVQCARHL